VLGDHRTGKVLLISFWDGDGATNALPDVGALDTQIGQVMPLLLSPPTRDHYEVSVEQGTLGVKAEHAAARVTTGQAQPGQLEEIGRIFREDVAPVVQGQKGFVDTLLLGDAQHNRSLSVSPWQSDADLHASEHSAHYHEQVAKLAHLYVGPATREHFVVLVHL